MTVADQKKRLRREMLEKRVGIPASERMRIQQAICTRLIALAEEWSAKVVHTYLPMGDEVDHSAFINHCLERGITVVAPKTLPKRQLQHLVFEGFDKLEKGVYGTRHPDGKIEWNEGYDLIVVPGLLFDKSGNRIGYGAGYYDSFLNEHREALKVAVCFPMQLSESVPTEAFDVRVDEVITGE